MTRDPDMIRVSARHLRRLLGRAGRGGGNPARAFFVPATIISMGVRRRRQRREPPPEQ